MIINSNDKQISAMLSLLNKLGIPAQDWRCIFAKSIRKPEK